MRKAPFAGRPKHGETDSEKSVRRKRDEAAVSLEAFEKGILHNLEGSFRWLLRRIRGLRRAKSEIRSASNGAKDAEIAF